MDAAGERRSEGGAGPAVERSVVLDAGADEVWAAIVEPGALEDWFGGPARIEAVEGGRGYFSDGGVVRAAEVIEVRPAERLAWRWWRAGSAGDDAGTVEVDLTEEDGRTTVRVVERAGARRAAGPRAGAVPQHSADGGGARRPPALAATGPATGA